MSVERNFWTDWFWWHN